MPSRPLGLKICGFGVGIGSLQFFSQGRASVNTGTSSQRLENMKDYESILWNMLNNKLEEFIDWISSITANHGPAWLKLPAIQVESQQALQKKIFQERCVELQAKLDKSRVAYYEKGRELQVVRRPRWEGGTGRRKTAENGGKSTAGFFKNSLRHVLPSGNLT